MNIKKRDEGTREVTLQANKETPVPVARFDIEEYLEGRRAVTGEERIDLLLRSVGLEPIRMEKRFKPTWLSSVGHPPE